MTKRKKIIIGIVAAVVLIAALILFFIYKGLVPSIGGGGEVAYVQQVSTITGYDLTVDRYAGVVESQTAINYKKDADRTIEEVYVKEGDTVSKGTALFKYDVRSSENNIASINLDIEGLTNEINYLKSQGNSTEITLQISERELEIKQKQADLKRYQQEIEQAEVHSEITGVVKAVNERGEDGNGNDQPVVVISETGEFRVKGKVSEQSISTLSNGLSVIVRSRVNENETWKGSISKIDTENTSNDGGNEYDFYGGGERSTSYPFYITLESTVGLMLGQHVFIEPDYGQSDAGSKDGLWIDQSFVVFDDEGKAYVWAERNGKLDKRPIEVGQTDETDFTIKIESGLTKEDYIAWPDETLREGMKTADVMEGVGEGTEIEE